MKLPEELWEMLKARAEGVRFGSITISFSEQTGAISMTTKIDERLLTNGKSGDSVRAIES